MDMIDHRFSTLMAGKCNDEQFEEDGVFSFINYFSNPDVEYCDLNGICMATGTATENNAEAITLNMVRPQDVALWCHR